MRKLDLRLRFPSSEDETRAQIYLPDLRHTLPARRRAPSHGDGEPIDDDLLRVDSPVRLACLAVVERLAGL